MKRIVTDYKDRRNFYFEQGMTIGEMIEELEKVSDNYIIEIEGDDGLRLFSVDFWAYNQREETDEEYQNRLKQEEIGKQDLEAREYNEYLRLKEKYENGKARSL